MASQQRIPLKVMGLSYTQIQQGAYALILQQVGGPYRIPVVIGAAEAQSIAVRMEHIVPPRPLTHDLFTSFAHAFGIKLTEVFIYKFEDGIFSSELTFSDGDRTVSLDARTSDAIAIAMRTHAPIFTTPDILHETGFIIEDDPANIPSDGSETAPDNIPANDEPRIENYTIEELERTLKRLISEENYEEAAKVSEILKKKRADRQ
ncbi:MAG: bifunctional nuclease family protein [Muribaculum sp.]|nr:bifunctional nuclease family protein [Muribaculum sp.]